MDPPESDFLAPEEDEDEVVVEEVEYPEELQEPVQAAAAVAAAAAAAVEDDGIGVFPNNNADVDEYGAEAPKIRATDEDQEEESDIITVHCPCGHTAVTADTPPLTAAICHCTDCQTLTNGGTALQCVLWPTTMNNSCLNITQGRLVSYQRPENNIDTTVHACSDCGIEVYHTDNKNKRDGIGLTLIQRSYPDNKKLPRSCRPTAHYWYKDRVLDVNDNKRPKYHDLPEFLGGSGLLCNADGSILEETEEEIV